MQGAQVHAQCYICVLLQLQTWSLTFGHSLVCSASHVHLLPISGHCISVGSQHLLRGRRGLLYSFSGWISGKERFIVLLVVTHAQLAGVGTGGCSPKFSLGVWASCLVSVLSLVAILNPCGCQLYQSLLHGYLRCYQFSCLSWESFNASDWDSLKERIWSIPDNGMANSSFVLRLFFSTYFKDCWHMWVFLGLWYLWFQSSKGQKQSSLCAGV